MDGNGSAGNVINGSGCGYVVRILGRSEAIGNGVGFRFAVGPFAGEFDVVARHVEAAGGNGSVIGVPSGERPGADYIGICGIIDVDIFPSAVDGNGSAGNVIDGSGCGYAIRILGRGKAIGNGVGLRFCIYPFAVNCDIRGANIDRSNGRIIIFDCMPTDKTPSPNDYTGFRFIYCGKVIGKRGFCRVYVHGFRSRKLCCYSSGKCSAVGIVELIGQGNCGVACCAVDVEIIVGHNCGESINP